MQMRLITLKVSCVLAMAIVGCSSSNGDKSGAAVDSAMPGGMVPVGPGGTTPMAGGPGTAGAPATMTPVTPAAGAGGAPAVMMGAGGAAAPDMTAPIADIRGTGVCADLHTTFPGDKACLPPPAAGEGMQIHIGPTSYTDMAVLAPWLVKPGQEDSVCVNFHTPNGEKVYYQTYQLSGREGTHHIFNTMYMNQLADGVYQACLDMGTGTTPNLGELPGAPKAYMPRTTVAPENADLGRSVPPKVAGQAGMHYFNFGDKDVLREFWLNLYFIDASKVKQEPNRVRGMGGFGWSFAPIKMSPTPQVFKYTCPVPSDGRIIGLLGHYHSHGRRFTAWVRHASGVRDKVFESFDYAEAQAFPYDTITTNPTFSASAAGATTGILNVKAGDALDWECEVLNDDQAGGLRYTNEVKTGEMCNLWGESIGPNISCTLL